MTYRTVGVPIRAGTDPGDSAVVKAAIAYAREQGWRFRDTYVRYLRTDPTLSPAWNLAVVGFAMNAPPVDDDEPLREYQVLLSARVNTTVWAQDEDEASDIAISELEEERVVWDVDAVHPVNRAKGAA